MTLRIHGHAAHDDARYVPEELRAAYATRDPVARLEGRLRQDGVGDDALDDVRRDAAAAVADGLADAERSPAPDPATLEDGVWAAPPPA